MLEARSDSSDVTTSTTATFVTALVTAAITVGVCAIFWLVLHNRKSLVRVYQPRNILAEDGKREQPLPGAPHSWFHQVFTLDDTEILRLNGPDAYFFVRFVKIFGLYMMLPYMVLTLAVCVPASAVSPQADGTTELNILTFGAVPASQPNRHLAHFFVSFILMLLTLYLLWREYHHYMEIRLNWLRSERGSVKSRTVALVNVPKDMFSEAGIKEIAGGLAASGSVPRHSDVGTVAAGANAGGVTHVWLARKVKPVEKVWENRDKEVYRLEGGVGKLLKLALKNERKGKTPEQLGTWDRESSSGSDAIIERYVPAKKVPKWKQGFLGLFGKKMNLETSPEYIREQNEELTKLRANPDDYEYGNVAFARFATQEEAHNFARLAKSSNKSLRMMDTKIEVVADDIIWSNTSMNPWQRKARTIGSWALTVGLIIVWGIITAFIGSISNLDAIKEQKGFTWLQKIPEIPFGIAKALLPTILLTLLFMVLPVILRIWIKLQGEIRKSDVELKLFTRFWLFQFIQGFIIMTLSSGLITALGDLGSTLSSVPTLLASKLPGASIFFLTYILVQTWANAAKSLARIVPYVMYQLRGFLAGGTPRKAYAQKYKMDSFGWSTTWPPVCLLLLICIVYSVIQPLITVVGIVGFVLFYFAYKYLLVWAADQDQAMETGGLYYIKALRTVFVALYTEQVCVAGLFFLTTGSDGKRTTVGLACGAIIVVVGVVTACMQAYFDHILFKRQTLLFGVRQAGFMTTSQTQLNAEAEKVSSAGPVDNASEEGLDREFDHPAMWKKQPCVWIADDPTLIGRHESARINDMGVESSTEFAHMNEKGQVTVDRSPPDEAWDDREPVDC